MRTAAPPSRPRVPLAGSAPPSTAPAGGINERIAARVHGLRVGRGLSLESLAALCGVSRSMISLIERAQSGATAVLLEKLATGLDVPFAALFDPPAPAHEPVARLADQPTWRDPHSGYLRRNVSPPGVPSPVQIVEVEFPAGASIAFETAARPTPVHQQVWILEGTMDITAGEERHRMQVGDCLAFALDRPTSFHNPTRRAARYAVVIATLSSARAWAHIAT